MIEVHSSLDYNRFISPCNRQLSQKNVNRLISEIKENGFVKRHAIVCKKEDGHLLIVDGQHRFHALKALKLPIYYQLLGRGEDFFSEMYRANVVNMAWKSGDYLNHFIDRGNQSYIYLKEFLEETRFPVNLCLKLLIQRGDSTGRAFKKGTIEIDGQNVLQGHQTVAKMKEIIFYNEKLALLKHDQAFQRSLANLVVHPLYEHDRMLKNLVNCSGRIQKATNVRDYLAMLGDVFNYRKSNKIDFSKKVKVA